MTRLTLVINPHAGAASGEAADALQARLEAAADWAQVRTVRIGSDVAAAVKDALGDGPVDIIAAAGGDGTARAVAEALARLGGKTALIALPLGTANLLPRRLYGDRDAERILAEARDYQPVRLHAGEANGRLFFIAAIAGFPVALAQAREAVRPKGGRRLRRAWRALRASMAGLLTRRLRVRFDDDRGQVSRAASVICVPGGLAAANAAPPAQSGETGLECISVRARSAAQTAGLTLAAITDAWRDHPAVAWRSAHGLTVSRSGAVAIMLDGEPERLGSPVRIQFREAAITCLAAPDDGA